MQSYAPGPWPGADNRQVVTDDQCPRSHGCARGQQDRHHRSCTGGHGVDVRDVNGRHVGHQLLMLWHVVGLGLDCGRGDGVEVFFRFPQVIF